MADWIRLNDSDELQVFHTLITGQTNLAGKTTAIRTLVPRLVREGFTVLIFDTKPTVREFEGYHDIPLCYKPSTDPLILLGLAESIAQRRMSPFFATLARASESASDMGEIIRNLEKAEQSAKSGFIKDACYSLVNILRRLETELADYSLSSTLDMESGRVNVMALNSLSSEAQQLVIKTAFELALKHHNRRTVLVIDEAFRFLPQAYSSACKKPVQDVITQGAKTGLFVWLATQFIATTEKDAIKGMANKLLGRQDDPTEIKATLERLRETKVSSDDLMTLKRGEFIFVPIDGKVRKIYVPMLEEMRNSERPKEPQRRVVSQPSKIDIAAGGLPSEIRSMKFESTKPNPLAPDKSFSAGLKIGANEGLEAAAKKVEEIQLEEKPIVVKISHSEIIVRETTETVKGQILFVLYSAGSGNELGIKAIVDEAAEHGWALDYTNVRKNTLPAMAKDGLIVGDGHGNYRLPRFVAFNIKETGP